MIYKKTKAKEIIYDKTAIDECVLKSLEMMASVVGATLGPGGRPVLIERDEMAPLISKDGVTVAKSLGVSKANENSIIETAKEICLNTAKSAGDGTTTAILLAHKLVEDGQIFLKENTKYNPQRFMSEIDLAYKEVIVPYLKKISKEANTDKKLFEVAKISANGDEEIAAAVVEAIMSAGDDGHVLILEDQGGKIRVQTIDGYIVTSGLKDLGSIGPVFINDKANQQCKMDNGLVFLYNGSMNDLQVAGYIQTALERNPQELLGKPLVVMAHDFADTVLEAFAKQVKGGYTIVPVITPYSNFTNSRSMFLEDMAIYTGAVVYDPGNKEQIDEDGFGNFTEARANMYETFLQATPDVDDVDQRVAELKKISENAFSEYDRMHLRAAISKLTGGLSTIYVGGASDVEIREKKARVEDAVESLRSAQAEGVIPGGCIIHLVMAILLKEHKKYCSSWDVLIHALKAPFTKLMENCGENPNAIYDKLEPYILKKKYRKVFDAAQHRIVNPFKVGIIEPAKVCRVALENAISVANLLITIGGLVIVPRDASLEMQMEMQSNAFSQMMANAGQGE